MPRRNRLSDKEEAYYHITTRIVDKIFRFTPKENQRNLELLRCVEGFSGVEVVSFCFMSNHLHILLRVPPREAITETVLLERIALLYGDKEARLIRNRWNACKEDHKDLVERDQMSYLRRMYDMGEFMKTLKQRLTMSYNARHDREGTLWERRYNSILLEPTEAVLSAVAAYIELNPVRAGMVSDASQYRFSSYGNACRGDVHARAGLCRIYADKKSVPEWKDIVSVFRERLVLKILTPRKHIMLTEEAIQKAMNNQGAYTFSEIVGVRNRYFSIGTALGSIEFVAAIDLLLALKRQLVTLLPLKE